MHRNILLITIFGFCSKYMLQYVEKTSEADLGLNVRSYGNITLVPPITAPQLC